MVCSVISDMELTPRLEARLRDTINELTDTYLHIDFIVGNISGMEKAAYKIINEVQYKSYFITCRRVSLDRNKSNDVLVPAAIEMVRPECITAWRNRWMMQMSNVAVICIKDRAALPAANDIHRMKIIDILKQKEPA